MFKCVKLLLLLQLSHFSRVRLCATPEMAARGLPHPWDSPGKNTGVGCHFLLQCMKVKVKLLSCVQPSGTPWTAAYQSPPSWDFPGKSTGVGCHCLLQCMKVKSESEVVQSSPTLRDPMDCSPPGSSVHRILQASLLEWVAIPFSRGSSQH